MPRMTGSCRCGQIRYAADAEPIFTGICHCTECQKQSGTAFNIVVAVPQPLLAIEGSPKTYTSTGDSGRQVTSRFCPNCGSTIVVEAEAMLAVFSTLRIGRPALDPKLHGLLIVVAAFAAATPLLANFAQVAGFSTILAIVVGTVLAALAQAGLWSIVYVFTGVALDWIGGKPPTFVSVYAHWRVGLIKGAIYGGLFMFGLLALAAPLLSAAFASLGSTVFTTFALSGSPVFEIII